MISIRIEPEFTAWRTKARELLENRISPDAVLWSDTRTTFQDLFGDSPDGEIPHIEKKAKVTISKTFLDIARCVACHSSPERWALLYRIAWRMTHGGEKHLLKLATEDDVRTLFEMQKAIRRDCHKMNAFVRFRKTGTDPDTGREQFVAWFEPSHYIIEYNAQFFVKRFTGMDWSILSPSACIHWDGSELHITEGVSREAAPSEDELEKLWLGYYKSIFNPARLKLKAMQAEMPKKYWKNLPEAPLISELTRESSQRVNEMIERETRQPKPAPGNRYLQELHQSNETGFTTDIEAAAFDPGNDLDKLQEAASTCRACPLWEKATQTVFGHGPEDAEIMIIGEQPGDEEDIRGIPFSGPAGRLLDEALEKAGLVREEIYLTNAVKHFKWKASSNRKKRLHDKANLHEIHTCRPWLIGEVMRVQPQVIITLGNTAARSVIRKDFKILAERGIVPGGENQIGFPGTIIASIHPSFLLRLPDRDRKQEEMVKFISDLKLAA